MNEKKVKDLSIFDALDELYGHTEHNGIIEKRDDELYKHIRNYIMSLLQLLPSTTYGEHNHDH